MRIAGFVGVTSDKTGFGRTRSVGLAFSSIGHSKCNIANERMLNHSKAIRRRHCSWLWWPNVLSVTTVSKQTDLYAVGHYNPIIAFWVIGVVQVFVKLSKMAPRFVRTNSDMPNWQRRRLRKMTPMLPHPVNWWAQIRCLWKDLPMVFHDI